MRVLYSFPFQLGAPGIGTTALQQVLGLIDAGVEVDVMCGSARVRPQGARVTQTLVVAGVRVPHHALGDPRRVLALHDRRVAARVRRYADRYDVIHVWPRGCLHTAATARRAGVPVLREAPSPHTAAAFEDARAAAQLFGLELPSTHSHAWKPDVLAREIAEYEAVDGILVPSEYARQTFVERGVAASRLWRTSYGYDPRRFTPGEHPPATGLIAAFVGRGEPNKGLHLALDAWFDSGASSRGTLHVVGRLWEPYADLLGDRLDHPSVVRHGFADPAALLAEADVLLLPSYTEGSALVVFEAMGCGCVPLVSTASGAPVEPGVSGMVHDPGDAAALTEQLRLLDSDRTELERLRAGVLAAAPSLTWSAAGRRLADVYRSVVAASAPRDGKSRRAFAE